MLDFLSRFYVPLSLAILAVLTLLTSQLSGGIEQLLDRYLSHVVGWLGVTVLIWLWKFEKDWKRDLKSELLPKVKDNENLIAKFWNVFSGDVAVTELEKGLRKVVREYPSVVLEQKDDKIGEKVRENIETAGDILQSREYTVYFDAMTEVYPGPFYESAKQSIIATNIGGPGNFWQDRETLVEMNRKAVARIQPTLPEGEHAIRRVFIIRKTEKNEIEELKKLMDELHRAGVVIKYLGSKRAEDLVVTAEIPLIAQLEDFTVFGTEHESLKYAGSFQDLSANYKKVIISSAPQRIESLTRHFEVLWNASVEYEGKIEPLYQLGRGQD